MNEPYKCKNCGEEIEDEEGFCCDECGHEYYDDLLED
jgi:predicted nucleic acid-binding Zn ribbon protein